MKTFNSKIITIKPIISPEGIDTLKVEITIDTGHTLSDYQGFFKVNDNVIVECSRLGPIGLRKK